MQVITTKKGLHLISQDRNKKIRLKGLFCTVGVYCRSLLQKTLLNNKEQCQPCSCFSNYMVS